MLVPPVVSPTVAQFDVVYRRYLFSLRAAFEKYRYEAGCGNDEIVFSPAEYPLNCKFK